MQLTTSEAEKLIHKLGLESKKCKHHIRAFFVYNGRKVFPVHCSFGNKDMPGKVPIRFRESLKLDPEEFEVLRSCKINREKYILLLISKGIIEE